MDNTIINSWFNTELVTSDEMKYVNSLLGQLLQASNSVNAVFGVVPTITGSDFSVTAGFAYFGETSDPTYIAATGSSILYASIPAEGAISLIDPDCYIYVKPDLAYSLDNKTVTVTGIVYSSTNPADMGIKICQVVASVPTNFNTNNISNYFSVNNNTLKPQNPDGTPILFTPEGINSLSIKSGIYQSITTEEGGGGGEVEWNLWLANNLDAPSDNAMRFFMALNPVGVASSNIGINTYAGGVLQNQWYVPNTGRITFSQATYTPPANNDVLVLQDIDSGNGIAKYGNVAGGDGLIDWNISISSFNPNGTHGSAILAGSIEEAEFGSPIINTGNYGIGLSELAGYLPSSLPDGGYIGTITADSSSIQWGGGCFIGSNTINIEWEFATTAPSSVTISFSMVITW